MLSHPKLEKMAVNGKDYFPTSTNKSLIKSSVILP